VPVLLLALPTGPPARSVGGPDGQTCARLTCHVGTANTGPGRVEFVRQGAQAMYPEEADVTVRVTGTSAQVYGFQLSARPATNTTNGQAGSLFLVLG
jgi:hypothetical protein